MSLVEAQNVLADTPLWTKVNLQASPILVPSSSSDEATELKDLPRWHGVDPVTAIECQIAKSKILFRGCTRVAGARSARTRP